MKHFTSDQGSEIRQIVYAPFGNYGEDVTAVLQQLRVGTLRLSDAVGRQVYFLMNCMEHADALHVMYNSVQEEIERLEEWPVALPMLRGLCKALGNTQYK